MQPVVSDNRALLIDAMGTLVRLEPPAPALRRELSRRFGAELSLEQARSALAAEIGFYRAHMQEGRDARSVRALHLRCAEALRAALPASGLPRRLDSAALTEALLASLRFTVFEDALPALRAARARGERVIVVSNWDVSLHDVLERAGLAALLDGVLTSAAAGSRKPQRAIFERALRLAGVRAEGALHVGDSLEEDVAGARAAGIAAVWCNRSGAPVPPGVESIAGLDELRWPT
ncbi:MAG: HAD family hydrolase [Solirubrobacteraceae bacterium]